MIDSGRARRNLNVVLGFRARSKFLYYCTNCSKMRYALKTILNIVRGATNSSRSSIGSFYFSSLDMALPFFYASS